MGAKLMTQTQINALINRLDKVQPHINQLCEGDSYKRAVIRMAIFATLEEMAT